MGRRGPAPAPTRVKLLHGETRPSRVNYREPVPASTAPKMPANMSPRAKEVWRHKVRNSPPGVLRSLYADTLRCYCEAVDRYEQDVALYARTGPLIRGQQGNLVKNPLRQFLGAEAEMILRFGGVLGFSPSANAGLRVDQEHELDGVSADIGLPPRLRAVASGD